MPTATRGGRSLYYETDGGETRSDGQPVAFVSESGIGPWLWGWQQPRVAGPRRTLVWDLPGTGRSDPPGTLSVDSLAADFEAVLAAAGVERAHVVGAGLGGMVALRYARRHDRARTLTLCATAASGDAVDEEALRALHPDGERDCETSLDGAFSPEFRETRPDLVERICEWRRVEDATGDALDAHVDAMLGFEAGPLYEVALPTLVLSGVDDPVVPAAAGETLAEGLPRGNHEPVEGRHFSFVEHARAVTDRLLAHLDEHDDG